MSVRVGPAPPPVTVIRPRRGWSAADLQEIWDHRELLYFLIWRDLKVRYKQTAFGALWALIQPFMLLAAFTLVLGRIPGLGSGEIPYPLFAFAALVPWTLFAQSVVASSNSLVNAAHMIQKVYFPRLLLPIASVGAYLVDFAIAATVLLLLLMVSGHAPGLSAIWILPLAGLCVASALSLGIWLSAVNVRYRDVRHAVPFLVQVGLLASPVAYGVNVIPAEWRPIFLLNPMTGVIEGFRWSLFGGGPAPLAALATSVIVTIVVLFTGLAYFRRVERTFADVI